MACHLVGAKPLSEKKMQEYYQVKSQEQSSVLKRNSHIFPQKMHLKISSVKWGPICLGLCVLGNCLYRTMYLYHRAHYDVTVMHWSLGDMSVILKVTLQISI